MAAKLPERFEVDSYPITGIPPGRICYIPNKDLEIHYKRYWLNDRRIFHDGLSRTLRVSTRKSNTAQTAVWNANGKIVFDKKTAVDLDCRWKERSDETLEARQCTISDIPWGVTVLLEEARLGVANDGTIWTAADTPVSFSDRFWLGTAAVSRGSYDVVESRGGALSLMIDAGTSRRWTLQGDVPADAVRFCDVQTVSPPVWQNALDHGLRGWDLLLFLLRAK